MTMKGSALEGFAALYDGSGNADAVVGATVQTKVTVDYELVRLCHQHGDGPKRGSPLGQMPELWPFDMLKRPLVEHAQEFTRQVEDKGYRALTNVYAFKVWGPYMEKVGDIVEYVPEEGNHVIPKHLQRKAVRVFGYQGDEFNWHKGVSFLLVGEFAIPASFGHVSDEDGRIWV